MRKLYVSALLLLIQWYAVQAQNPVTYENNILPHGILAQNNALANAYAALTASDIDVQPNEAANVNVYWIITANTITADQTICYNTTPAALTGTVPAGGNGTFTYQWQLSSTSAVAGFANITGATSQGYAPGALTANRWYRRIVTSGIEKDTSLVVQITVTPVINGAFNVISASQIICTGTAPALLTGTTPAGGNGTYTFQWQSSPDNITFTNITSAVSDTYAAPVLTVTVYYKRIVYSGNCSHTSTSIKITVTPVLASNSFTQEQSVCSGQTPVAFVGSTPTGGTGTYTYLWQSSTASASAGFATAPGVSNGKPYSPAALTQTTWFRRVVTSGGCADTSAATVITVYNTAPGNPAVFGNGAWNVYAYSDKSFTSYAGFYTEPSLSFLTTDRYTLAQSPSYASGYQGCMVPVTNFSVSMKRTNFPAGVYQLDLTALDDSIYVFVNGVQVYARICCVVPPAVTSNIWTGSLGAGDQMEIKWIQLASTSRLGINFTTVTPTPLVAGAISNSQSVCYGEAPASGFTNTSAASGGCSYTGYQWQNSIDSITWINIPGATGLTYTETSALTQTQWYRRLISDACYNSNATLPVKITVNVIPPGDTSVYGDNTWNVYEYQYLPANSNFSAASYKGYYTEPSLSFNSTSRWANGASPSLASGYQGCYVAPSYHWMSYKRTDFATATYQIDVPAHDDNVYVYLNGLLIFSHAGCCDAHTNIWTGPLGATDQLEMRVMQGGGGAYGAITLTPVTPLPLTAGSITPNQTICAGNVPPNPMVQSTAPINGCTIKNYGWESSVDNGATWTTVSGATANNYTIPGSIYTQTLYRRIVYDVCGNSAASVPDTIYMNGSAPGNPAVFGNGVWNVYCFQDVNYSIYSGYYTEPSLTFATTSRYPSTSPPSIASGYMGCQLINNYYSVSMKRTGFTTGLYQIDVTADDDYLSIYINGALVSSLTYPTIQNNVWTGNLSAADQVEVRWRNNAGPGQAGVKFTLVTTTPLDPGTISANNPSVCAADVPIISSVTAATGACYVNYSWQTSTDGGTTWNTISGAAGISYTASTALIINTQFRRVATDVCGAVAYTPPVAFTVGAGPLGDPTVFGNGMWNVYAYNANGTPFGAATYMGYYTEPLLSFNSLTRWGSNGAPSQASGYLGCQVDPDNHWVSYRRTNFAPGTYQLDITTHDDPVYVYINGVLVFTHATCCDTHTNIWTGNLGAADKVEFLWREYNGGSNGGMNLTLVTPPTGVTGGTISASQTICSGTIPAAFANVDSALSSCYVYYQWQYQTNCTGGWTDIASATGAAYMVSPALTVNTCYRRAAINACGVTAYSNTITENIYSTTLTAGAIATNQIICKSATAAILTNTTLPTGGDGNYIYQWQSSADNIGWTNITGATSLTYAPGVMTTSTYLRRNVTACGATAAASSASVLITVNQPPVITVQPANAVACTGANTSITVMATGTTLTYQWQVNTGSGWVNVTNTGVYTGATNSTLNISGVTAAMNTYTYRAIISGSCTPSLTSNIVSLTTGPAPSVSGQPVNTTTCVGSNAVFSVTASGSGLTYQWQQRPGSGAYSNISDGGIYSGTGTNALTLTGVTAGMNNYSYQCIVTSSCAGTVTSSIGVLTVVTAINNTITADQSVCTGMTAVALTGTSSGAYTYLWQSSTVSASAGFVTASGTNNAYNYNPNPISTTIWYRRLVTNTGCSALSNVVNIAISSTPLIINVSPAAQIICAGDNATFTVSASGPGTLTYQWYEYVGGVWTAITNGGIYSGATSATLALTGATAGMNNYRYYAKVFASGCSVNSVNSNNALLTTNSVPVITTNPADVTSCAGNNVAISVTATGLGLTYQWQQNTGSGWSNLANYGIYADVNTNILRLYGVATANNASQYRCVVTGTCAPYTVTSGASTLTINPAVANNSISNSQNLCAGTPVPFTGSTPTGGDGTFTYQWMQNTGSGWTNITGATAVDYAPGPLTQTTQFMRTVSSGSACASNNSIAITVTINPATVTTDPKDTTVCAGNTITFSVTGTGTGLGYQWQAKSPSASFANISNGVQYTGVSTTTLSVITPAYALNGYQYRCIVSGNCSPPTITSNAATLILNPVATITAQPSNVNSCAGSTAVFSVTAGGTGLVYQWKEKIGSGAFNNITDGGVYSGAVTAMLTLTGITTAMNTNQYMCVITAGSCPVNSANASLTVNQQPSLVITNPATVCAPATVNITAAAVTTGSNLAGGTLTYWTNATATTALSNPSAISLSGTYYIRVATSPVCYDIKPVTVTINPSILNNNISSAQTICIGSAPAAFTGSIPTGGNGVYTYQWQSSPDNATWSDISGATSIGYAAGVLTSTTWYRRVVNSNVCTGISAAIKVAVDPMPVAAISYSGSPYCAIGTAAVTQTGQGGGVYSSATGLSINGGTGAINLASSTPNTYTVTYSFSSGACSNSTSTTVTINALPTVTITDPAAVCSPATVDITVAAVTAGSTGGLTYTYFTDAAATTILSNPNAITTSGTYYIKGTAATGCLVIKSVTVTINPLPTATISYAGTPFCATGSAGVTQTGQAGGTYSSTTGLSINATTGAINLTSSTAATYIVTYTFSNGTCGNTTTTSVTINPLPTIIITNPAAVCSPATVDITAATITTGSTSGLTYTYFTDATAISSLTNPNAVATSDTYYIKGTTGLGCFVIKPVVVTINPLSTAAISYAGTPFCATGSASVTQTGQAGGTYSSTTGLSINASTGTINLVTSTANTYIVTYSFSNGTCSNTTTTSIVINPLPTVIVTNPAAVCSPGTIDITAASITAGSTSGLTYTYFIDAAATSALANPNAVAISGTYYIKGTAATGCYTIKSVVVAVNLLPTATISYAGTPFCATGSASVTQTGQTGGTYSSTTGLSINASTGAINLAGSTANTYIVTYSFSNGTCGNTTTTSVTINALPTIIITNPSAVCSPTTIDITTAAITAGSSSGSTYSYFTDVAATSILTNPIAVATSGTYYIKGTTAAGCFAILPVTVTINPLPVLIITSPIALCAPNTVDITAAAITAGSTSGLTYTYFTDAAATSVLTSPNAIATSSTYYIKGTTVAGCYIIKPVTVTINSLPTASISYAGTPYCASGTAAVTQTGQAGGIYSSTTGLSIDANTGTINLASSIANTYTVTYTFSDGSCSNTTSTNVVINNMPTATIAYTGSPYCASGNATVTRTGQAGGTFTSATGLNIDATTGAINLATSNPGSYVVFYNYSNGLCANMSTASIVINTPPTISVTNPPAICAPGKIDLTLPAFVNGTGTGLSFAYFSDAAGLNSFPSPTAAGTGTYYVKAVDVSHCESALLPVVVNIMSQPSISTSGNTILCLGNNTVISASSPGSTLSWQTLGSNTSYTVAPIATTNYVVTATNSNSCQTTAVVRITVENFDATLESNPSPVLSGSNVLLTAGGNTSFSVLAWTPTSVFSNQTTVTQSFIIMDTTLYGVIVKSQAGCIDTAYLKVSPEPNTQDFFMPNAFTPNGDGKNDIFKAYGISIKELELRVFNQWGQLLYETKNPTAGWNGVYRGNVQPAGPYVYTVKVLLYSGRTFSKKGTFNLIR